MEIHEIARILVNMSLDMDFMDYAEGSEEGILVVEEELESLKEADSYLYDVLEKIAYKNQDSTDLLSEMENTDKI